SRPRPPSEALPEPDRGERILPAPEAESRRQDGAQVVLPLRTHVYRGAVERQDASLHGVVHPAAVFTASPSGTPAETRAAAIPPRAMAAMICSPFPGICHACAA